MLYIVFQKANILLCFAEQLANFLCSELVVALVLKSRVTCKPTDN